MISWLGLGFAMGGSGVYDRFVCGYLGGACACLAIVSTLWLPTVDFD